MLKNSTFLRSICLLLIFSTAIMPLLVSCNSGSENIDTSDTPTVIIDPTEDANTDAESQTEKNTEKQTEAVTEEPNTDAESQTEKNTEKQTEAVTEEQTENNDNDIDFSGYGLQVDDEGVIKLNGKPFYGMGVNFHGIVTMRIGNRKDFDVYFQKLEDASIPYIRVMFGIFYAKDVKVYTDSNLHKQLIKSMDYLVAEAEKHHIGIIASLFWSLGAFNYYYNETFDDLGDPESKGGKLQLEYIKEIVGRYKYSPALWAWEVGNEGNLSCEIDSYTDKNGKTKLITTDMLTNYYKFIGEAIRKEDPYRMITGGDSVPRNGSAALKKTHGSSWTPYNTLNDYKSSFEWYTPEPLDTISIHYPDVKFSRQAVKLAKELKKGLFIGEFHGELFYNPNDKLSPEESPEEANEQSTWLKLRDGFINNGVQLATAWCYGRLAEVAEDSSSIEVGMIDGVYQNVYAYEGLKEANEMYLSEGKSDAPAYWNSVKYMF